MEDSRQLLREEILDQPYSLLGLLSDQTNPLVCAVQYGSRMHDLDILAVYEQTPPRAEIMIGRLDLLAVGRAELDILCHSLDPYVTEPLLSGSLFAGSDGELTSARDSLAVVKPDWPAVRRLICRSHDAYANALSQFRRAGQDLPADPRAFSSNLSWALSLHHFAHYYSERIGKKGSVACLEDVVATLSEPMRCLWERIHALKSGRSIERMEEVLQSFEKSVLVALSTV